MLRLTLRIVMAGMTACLTTHLPTATAFAHQTLSQGQQLESDMAAIGEQIYSMGVVAERWSSENNGVGIVIAYGSFNQNADEVGQLFTDAFTSHGVEARYFVVDAPGTDGVAVYYHVGRAALGPYPVQRAALLVSEVVRLRVEGEAWLPGS